MTPSCVLSGEASERASQVIREKNKSSRCVRPAPALRVALQSRLPRERLSRCPQFRNIHIINNYEQRGLQRLGDLNRSNTIFSSILAPFLRLLTSASEHETGTRTTGCVTATDRGGGVDLSVSPRGEPYLSAEGSTPWDDPGQSQAPRACTSCSEREAVLGHSPRAMPVGARRICGPRQGLGHALPLARVGQAALAGVRAARSPNAEHRHLCGSPTRGAEAGPAAGRCAREAGRATSEASR